MLSQSLHSFNTQYCSYFIHIESFCKQNAVPYFPELDLCFVPKSILTKCPFFQQRVKCANFYL